MYFFSDFLIFGCLFVSGFHYGYYCKYSYKYDNLWNQWFCLLSVPLILVLAGGWFVRKNRKRKFLFENFYIIFYGLICSIISAVFLLTDKVDVSFYFIFGSMVIIFLPCYNYISLRVSTDGCRPARIALGNAMFYGGLTAGFAIFKEFEPRLAGWTIFGVSLFMIAGVIINEILQQCQCQNYKSSCDLVYNLLNEEKLIFAERKAITSMFVGRDDFCFKQNIQWLTVGCAGLCIVERCCFYSWSYLELMESSTKGYTGSDYLYLPYILYTSGCVVSSLLMLRYKPKLIYLMFALIKITLSAAILGVYSEMNTEDCFVLLCFYYISIGVYSSIGLQMLLESTPFLYTELTLATAFALEMIIMEVLKFESLNDNHWSRLWIMTAITMCLTAICIVLIQLFLPRSVGLIEIRNRLLGIHRQPVKSYENRLWKNNFFLQMEKPQGSVSVNLEKDRVFHQYPALDLGSKTKF
uniref:Major facilitator superfamily associated domain-containing protein n=1 Tax=Stomoxys calcitrans TaxID=35570 RepID=A0A1I8Q009_STOCA